jgi:nucleoside-diphosphate-sugar epimerase
VKGVLNVLNACSRAKSVRRVVYTSSVAAACPLNEEGELINGCSLDESRWTPVDFLRKTHQNPLGVSIIRCLQKTMQIEVRVLTIVWRCAVLFRGQDFGRASSN